MSMSGYDIVMATVCGVMVVLTMFGLGVYFYAKHHMNSMS